MTNKTEKTAQIYVTYKKIKRRNFRLFYNA